MKKIASMLSMMFVLVSSVTSGDNFMMLDKKIEKINISTEKLEKGSEFVFFVPSEFKPKIQKNMFRVAFKYPNGEPVNAEDAVGDNVVTVLIDNCGANRMRSEGALKTVQAFSDSPKKSVPYYVGAEGDLDVYEYDYGSKSKSFAKIYSYKDGDGRPVIINSEGEWSARYRVYRKYSENIELDYQFSKTFKPSEFIAIDKKVVQVIRSFQP